MNYIKTSTTITLSLLLVVLSASVVLAQSDKGKEMSEQHRSDVANVVQDLTSLAGKDKNIGEDVSAVAKEQEASNERATEAIKAVEARGGFKTFLIGTDYKNIGALRSEVVTTQNSIDRLTKAMDRATDDSVKAELDTQIKALQETNTNALNFIQTNESKFSIFGWFVRLFR
jgi:microsomal dipeptidase-like Zn-dependent dipeptidase